VWAVQNFDAHPEEHMIAQYCDYILRIFKIILDVWVCATFVEVYRYMLDRKKEQLNESGQEWSSTNRFVIVWTLVLVGLNLAHSVGTIFYN
jgi:heme/copper-type cytochrome/quinol oxidase subunit 2